MLNKQTYLLLFTILVILLAGFYWTSRITDFWTSHFAHLGVILIAGFVLIGFKQKNIPEKDKPSLKTNQLLAILMGVVGLISLSNLIPVLASLILGTELNTITLREFGLSKVLYAMILIVVFEEILFRRLVTQKIKNTLGFGKAIWLSALIFSLAHVYTDSGLLSAFIGGVFFAAIYLKTNSILITIGSHLIYNLLSYFLVPYWLDSLNLHSGNGYLLVAGLIGLGLALIFGMFLILTRNGKKNKKPAANKGYNL